MIQMLGIPEEEYYVLTEERLDIREFDKVIDIIANLLKTLPTLPPLNQDSKPQKTNPSKPGFQPIPQNYLKKQ
jgi:hypothetical protein